MNRDELMRELDWAIGDCKSWADIMGARGQERGEKAYKRYAEFLEGLKGLIEGAERRYDELVETTGERIKQAEKEGK